MEVVDREGGAKALRDAEGWSIGGFMERHPVLMPFLDDDRIYEIPETLLGPDFVLEMTDGHVRAGNTPWHGRDPRNEKSATLHRDNVRVCIYFDSLNKETGCLRVIPGSQRMPYHKDLAQQEIDPASRPFGLEAQDIPCHALESEPGDVIFFDHCIWHSVSGGMQGRRYIGLKFAARPFAADHLESLETYTPNIFQPHEAFLNNSDLRIRGMVDNMADYAAGRLEE